MKKLIYRGVTYDYDPTRPAVDDRFDHLGQPISLQYRGNRYLLTPGVAVETPRALYQLQYRGVMYRVHPTGERETLAQPRAKTRAAVLNLTKAVHLTNLRRNLERRIDIAREKGDLNLMAMLEMERRQLS
jgi:hypothetical protein